MFSGRYKGALNERIQRAGIIASLLATQKNGNLKEIINANYENVKNDFSRDKIADQFEQVLSEVAKLHRQIYDDLEILDLKPLLNPRCEIFKNGNENTYEIYRMDSGKYLGFMDKRGRALIAKFDGKTTLKNCAIKAGLMKSDEMDALIDVTRKFWNLKIITFN
jgi:hypothetical protein